MASSSEFDGILLGMRNHFSTSPPSSQQIRHQVEQCHPRRGQTFAHWMLQIPGETSFMGSIGKDKYREAMKKDATAADVNELDEMKKRLRETEDEADALREMQAKVEKDMGPQGLF